MCGINGVFNIDQAENTEAITKMNLCLAHRGPDDQGIHSEEGMALGQTRLSIIDLSSAGHQPMYSNDKRYVLVFNGEIYNFRQLKSELDYPFVSGTDSEVIIAAYIKWGKDCVSHFNGMFAFAIWDTHEKVLFIARDRMGIKPLYFHRNERELLFSSEIRSLLASGKVAGKLSRSGLVDYMKYQTVHAPYTILQDVYMLEPGCIMTVSRNRDKLEVKKTNYWKPGQDRQDLSGKNYEEVKQLIRNKFTTAVERRLEADVPFGAFLSGGIDSSAIVGVMSQVADKQVKTFNISFTEKEFSEAKYAKIIAKKFNTDHHEIQLSPEHFLEQIPSALKSMDHPSGDGPNTWIVSKATREAGITMALSGLGGDELFAGYPVFKRMHKLHRKQWLWQTPGFLRRSGGSMLKKIKPGVATSKVADILELEEYDFSHIYSLSRQSLLSGQVNELLSFNSLLTSDNSRELINEHEILNDSHFLSRVSMAEINTYMQNVLLRDSDQMSMAHALEVRVPFLDHELVELALSIPDRFKYPVTPKMLLVESLGDLLPSEIVDRPKMGFTFPWEHWLKNELFTFSDNLLKNLSQRECFNSISVLDLWQRFNNGDPTVTYSRIWPLVVLEFWLTENGIE